MLFFMDSVWFKIILPANSMFAAMPIYGFWDIFSAFTCTLLKVPYILRNVMLFPEWQIFPSPNPASSRDQW